MNITELITPELIVFDKCINTKSELFTVLSNNLEKSGRISSSKKFVTDLYKREEELSTGVNEGFGMPHAKSKAVKQSSICFAHVSPMNDYRGLDETCIEYVFLLAVPENSNEEYLKILSTLSRNLIKDDFRNKIRDSIDSQEIIASVSSLFL